MAKREPNAKIVEMLVRENRAVLNSCIYINSFPTYLLSTYFVSTTVLRDAHVKKMCRS